MIRSDRAKYTHFHAGSNWRIWVIDEPDDVVIGVDHMDKSTSPESWVNVVRCDESSHATYHIHVAPNMDSRIEIPAASNREQKLKLGFDEIARLASSGAISVRGEKLTVDDVWLALREQVTERKAPLGTSHHNVSITGTARIISSLEAEKLPND